MTSVKPDILHNGFEACGLYPLDANAVDYSKCLEGANHFSGENVNGINMSNCNVTTNSPVQFNVS